VTEIGFYHLAQLSLERALPRLLERVLASGSRALVLAGSAERVEALNAHLWTYEERAWLPHGSAREGFAEDQPIWLCEREENANGADMLFMLDGVEPAFVGAFVRAFDLFDGGDDEAVAAARRRWRGWKAAGHALTYWRQDERGAWRREA
jgi:DNA polymerase III subunit chi